MKTSKNYDIMSAKKLTDANIAVINAVLAKDRRVELIPTKTGVRVIEIKREEVKS